MPQSLHKGETDFLLKRSAALSATTPAAGGGFLKNYRIEEFFEEVFSSDGEVRPHYRKLVDRFGQLKRSELQRRRQLAAAEEQNRDLIRAKITLAKEELETERQKNRLTLN